MRSPLVSVVIPTYNRWPLVIEAVESVLTQSLSDAEIIVVDDGSIDGTAEQLRERYPEVIVLEQGNAERAVARNHGLSAASGRYVMFLDDDDLFEPWHVAQFAEAERRATSERAFAARAWSWDPKTGRKKLQNTFDPATLATRAIVGTLIPASCLIVARTMLVALGGFVEDRSVSGSEDWILLMEVAHRCPVEPLPEPSVRMREHPGRSMNNLLAMSGSREAATRLILEHNLLGRELDREARRLLVAGTHRLSAAHLYGAGEMTEARARLRDVRRILGWPEGWRWTARLWLQTWLGPKASLLARRAKESLSWR